jgi:hypothetical protein
MKRRHVIATALSAPAVLSAGCSSLSQTAAVAEPVQPRSACQNRCRPPYQLTR